MSGFTDIDGRLVMAGSPDLVGCAEIELKQLLGLNVRPSSLVRLSRLVPEECPNPDIAADYSERAKRALELVQQAYDLLAQRP